MNAGIEGYKGGEGKIAGRVNVRGAWDWGRIPNGSRRLPEEMEDGEMRRWQEDAMKLASIFTRRRQQSSAFTTQKYQDNARNNFETAQLVLFNLKDHAQSN